MKTATRSGLGLLSALLLSSLLLVALAVQAAPAWAQSHDPRQRDGLDVLQPVGGSSTSSVLHDPRQSDGFDVLRPVAGITTSAVTNGAQPATWPATSTTSWMVAGSIAAALIIVLTAWALLRRRQPGERASATYCAHHLEDPACGAA
jgi:hypothetical protein